MLYPYDTLVGRMLNTTKLTEMLKKFLILSDNNHLNYEFMQSSDCKVVFVAGVDDDEKDLPIWEHPLVVDNHDGTKTIFTDVRKYVNPVPDMLNLSDHLRDTGGFEFTVTRTLMLADMIDSHNGYLRTIEKYIATGFTYWIADSLTALTGLNPVEKLYAEIAIAHYFTMLAIMEDIEKDDIAVAKIKIARLKLSIPTNGKIIDNVVDKLKHDVKSIDDLTSNIKIAVGLPKNEFIDTNILVNSINNSWFGPGGSECAIMACEELGTLVAVIISSITNRTYKRSRIATILDKHSKQINTKEFSKIAERYLADKKL